MNSAFDRIGNFDDLVCSVRRRYQMWVGDDISQLKGLFTGFCLARPTVDHHRLVEFEKFALAQLTASENGVASWTSAIQARAKHKISCIPLFFQLYESFCDKPSREIAHIKLSHAERMRFSNKDFLQFNSRNISTPCYFSLRHSEHWGATIIFLDQDAELFYELGVSSIEHGNQLVATYLRA